MTWSMLILRARGVGPERGIDQALVEAVVAGGDGGVGREDAVFLHESPSRGRSGTSAAQLFAEELEGQEGRVAFVHMEHGRLDAEGAQEADAADAQDDLLADPGPLVAAVDVGGQVADLLVVLRQIRVQQDTPSPVRPRRPTPGT